MFICVQIPEGKRSLDLRHGFNGDKNWGNVLCVLHCLLLRFFSEEYTDEATSPERFVSWFRRYLLTIRLIHFEWLTNCLNVWLTHWLRDWLTDRSIELFIYRLRFLLIDDQFIINSNRLETWILLYALRLLRANLTVALPVPTARDILHDIFKHIQVASLKFFRPAMLFCHTCHCINTASYKALSSNSNYKFRS